MDSDLARLYNCKNGTKEINQAVKNNPDKFPKRFVFKLTNEEEYVLKSKILTSSLNTYGGRRKLSYVFTEQGVYMLATIIKTKEASKVTIKIMDTFVMMRKFISENKDTYKEITIIRNKLLEHDDKINELFDKFERNGSIKQTIFFNGQIYDAYEVIVDLIKTAKESITIIDNYLDDGILKILSKKNENIKVLLITKNNTKINKLDIDKFNKEYPTINIKYDNTYHDRFIIIDNKELYHLGASIKDLGNKTFAINKIEDKRCVNMLIKQVNKY